MFTARVENANGEILTLTGREDKYQLFQIDGLDQPKAQINISTISGLDGGLFNSSRLETRNIVIYIRINGDVEKNRIELYRFFKTKEFCRFYFENGSRNVYADGYVDSAPCPIFTNSEIIQISIICPNPYLIGVKSETIGTVEIQDLFSFPFAIDVSDPVALSEISVNSEIVIHNDSDSETGVTVTADINADCDELTIKNTTTGDGITLEYSFLTNDEVIIETTKGKKSITLIRGASIINIFAAMTLDSAFFQLVPGDNDLDVLVDGEESETAVALTFKFSETFRGV